MRNLNNIAILLVALFFVSLSASATNGSTGFNKYEITTVNGLHLGKSVKAIWTLSYSHNEAPITVVKRKTMEGIEYIVQTDYFAVSYAATATGFGAKEVRKSWSTVPRKITNAVISQKEMARQAIITPNSVNDEQALGLIASYLPDLINEGYTHILN